jgi:intracellular multiplication protein IcmK
MSVSLKTRNVNRLGRRPLVFGALLLTAFSGVGGLAFAQDSAATLPSDFANQQVPPTFPTEGTQAPKAIDEVGAKVDESAVPAAPEDKKLVPSQPMGAAAQNASAQTKIPASAAPTKAAPADTGTDILEKYAANAGAEPTDSLPTVSDELMQGVDPALDASNPGMSMDAGTLEQKTPEELKAEIESQAYDAAITGIFPLRPDQIGDLVKRRDDTERAMRTPPYERPKPEISVKNVSLDPGVPPIEIKTAMGNVTTLNMLDATGSPWPVQDVTWAGDFEVIEPEQGGHIIRITPMSEFARGNLVIRLLTLKTPLTMSIETSRDTVQYRVDARIPEFGPFAKAPLMEGGKSLVAGSTDLTAVLDGVVPSGMKKLSVSGVDGRTTAYSAGNMTYVRTPMTLLSPAWQSSVSSADGMNVYALTSAPVVLLSDEGGFQRATISDKEELLDE